MPFDDDDLQDLLRQMDQHPEWRAELRRRVLSDEILELPALQRQLVEQVEALTRAQAHSAERLAGVETRQERLEQVVADLATRMNELASRMDQLTQRMDELIQRMDQLTALMESLAVSQQRTRQEVGSLSEIAGALAEADAQQAVGAVLRRKGFELMGRPGPLEVDGEIDVAAPVRDASGQQFWVLVESKARLRGGDVPGWEARLQNREFLEQLEFKGVTRPFLAYMFGLRVYADAQQQAKQFGIGVLDRDGELEEPTPRPL